MCRPGEYNLSFPVLSVQISARGRVELPENGTVMLSFGIPRVRTVYVTGFGKTDHIVTIDISRNTDLKYRSRHGSLVLDCSYARFAA